jgi:hypothetical protein
MCSLLAFVFSVFGVFADINVAPITENRVAIQDATIQTIQGAVSQDGQKNVYSFTAPRDGRYRFEMAELRSNAQVRLMAWNYLDENIADSYCRNGQGLTLNELVGGQTYEIQIRQSSGFSSYSLNVRMQ